jgi:hypothetical protein
LCHGRALVKPLALDIVDRVLEQHAVLVEEPVEVVPGREVQASGRDGVQ